MPDYYLRRHGNVWEIGQMRYGKPTPTHPDARTRHPLETHPAYQQARQHYDRLTGAAK